MQGHRKKGALQVLIKVRPSEDENSTSVNKLYVDSTNSQVMVNRAAKGNTVFTYDNVLGKDSSQSDLYQQCDHVKFVLNGNNACIMAYGQTSSGKTYSMFGKDWTDGLSIHKRIHHNVASNTNNADTNINSNINSNNNAIPDNEQQQRLFTEDFGVVPRCINDLFQSLNTLSNGNKHFEYTIHCHIMQIYNEKVYDLIQDKYRKNPLTIRDTTSSSTSSTGPTTSTNGYNTSNNTSSSGKSNKVHVKGLSQYRVNNEEEVVLLIKKSLKNRALRTTEYNIDSSRSHTIVQLYIQIEQADIHGIIYIRKSTLSFVDLAGSEKMSTKSVDDSYLNTIQLQIQNTQKETANINTSLHVLGLCVSSLIDPRHHHIPYRNSILTRLLQDSLNGLGRTTLIATIHEGKH